MTDLTHGFAGGWVQSATQVCDADHGPRSAVLEGRGKRHAVEDCGIHAAVIDAQQALKTALHGNMQALLNKIPQMAQV